MRNKLDELEFLAQSRSNDIISISETWWDESCEWCVATDGYRLLSRDRQDRPGGGVVLYVKERLDYMELAVGGGNVEILWVRIKGKTNKGDVVVGVYERQPSQDDNTNYSLRN